MATSIQIVDIELLTDLSVKEESVIQGGGYYYGDSDRDRDRDRDKDKDYGKEEEEKGKGEKREYNYYWEGFDKYSWKSKKDD